MEHTLTIIKPDAVKKRKIGNILSRLEGEGFRILGMKFIHLSQAKAEGFYYVHRERPFFPSLVKFMTEGPVLVIVLEKENAVADLRKVMGATDPAKADPGTIRKELAENIERNVIHGSDSPQSAEFEIGYFFSKMELL
ncbi:MAG TPA: nucleoside-diphosphate kinase [Acidobacteriota bacterium]|jgi:nucleoside-diphosphate kinase|nr:nucleoside-diphosphate kinase [Acidobacteriota bacterium]